MKTASLFFTAAFLPLAAFAVEGSDMARDRDFAVSKLSEKDRAACLSDYNTRNKQLSAVSAGKLDFSEPLTQVVYKTFYWKNSDRGVAFVMPVQAEAAEKPANIACFYAVGKNSLNFQLSQKLAQK